MIILKSQNTRVQPSFQKVHFSKNHRRDVPGLSKFWRNAAFVRSIITFKKDCHTDNFSFVYLQSYKHNCLNIYVGKICFVKQVMNEY